MDHNQASSLKHEEVAKVLQTDLSTGLTSFEVRERLKKYGHNKLDGEACAQNKLTKCLVGYFSQFMNPLIELLLICVIISASLGEYGNSLSVLVAILLVCTISYVQQRRADNSLEKLTNQMPQVCKVIREGKNQEIESQYLVPGDIILLSEGQRVPADTRLFDLHSLAINESNLTGEMAAQNKIEAPTSEILFSALNGEVSVEEDKNLIFQNLAMMGTMVEFGHSRGIVICTANSTRYGHVFSLLKNTIQPRSPLQTNIDQLSLHLVIISCVVIALMSTIGIIQHRAPLEIAYYAVSLAVTAIPEGLPVVVAVIMALGVMRLSKQKTIIRSLTSIETLGCLQVLCADKTGTLTRNDMTLTDIVTSELHSLSSGELEELNKEECRKHMTFNKFGGKMYSIGRLMEVGTLCNNATLDLSAITGDDSLGRQYVGSATECAILDASLRMGFGDSRTKFDRLSEVPFSSSSRRMAVQCRRLDLPSNSPMYYVKGAWEEILDECSHYYECGLVKPKADDMWREYGRIATALGSQGLRVLALATGPTLGHLTFVGLIGINNAPRDGIVNTLNVLRQRYHIDIKMITGDSKPTAMAIGRKLKLLDEYNLADEEQYVMSGKQMDELLQSKEVDELQVAHTICSKTVFYRVDPIQKAEIVGRLQQLDKIVAMTGDGVNDVISLKRANLSLAMGSGADVCKEIADVVLVDNDLSVLTTAVIEGKGIYHKIHSFMSYQISISLSLLILVGSAFACRTDPPFSVIQLLYLNLLTDGPPAQCLGVERVNEGELSMKPRNVHEPIISCHLLGTLCIMTTILVGLNGTLYFVMLEDGQLDAYSRCILFTCFTFCSIFATLSLRSKMKTVFESNLFGNKELLCCISIVLLVQIANIYVSFLNNLFDIEPISLVELLCVVLYSSLVLVIMDSAKVITRLCNYLLARKLK